MPHSAAEVTLTTSQSLPRSVNISPRPSKLSQTSSINERLFLHPNKDHKWRHLASCGLCKAVYKYIGCFSFDIIHVGPTATGFALGAKNNEARKRFWKAQIL